MGIQQLSIEVARLLTSREPEVLCITGKWGVGKTYAWNHYLRQALQESRIGLDAYSYVSLFGQNSLHDVRYALFEQKVGKAQIGKKADFTTLEAAVKGVPSMLRKAIGVGRYFLPQTKDIADISDRLGFFSVRQQIVCLDDLERRGAGLQTKDVLGLVGFLKEERDCKVVLLLNDDAMQGEEKADFNRQLEKVADTVLRFEPTPVEAADIGIDKATSFHEQLHANCVALGLVNIRVIKRAERLARRLEDELKAFDPRVLKQAIHSMVLFTFAKFQPDIAPPLEFIRTFNPYERLFKDKREVPSPQHEAWRTQLAHYNFNHLDEFDLVILDSVYQGHIDASALQAAAAKQDGQFKSEDQNQEFHRAWDLFHGSFANDDEAVLDAMEEAIEKCAIVISPMNLSSSLGLLKEMGRSERAKELLEHYVQSRTEQSEFWALDRSPFGGEIRDPDVRAAFKEKSVAVAAKRDLAETLIRIGTRSGWNPEDVSFLASVPPFDYYNLFKQSSGDTLNNILSGALMFRNIGNADEQMKAVTANVIEAMRQISKDSPMNARRVAKFIKPE